MEITRGKKTSWITSVDGICPLGFQLTVSYNGPGRVNIYKSKGSYSPVTIGQAREILECWNAAIMEGKRIIALP